MRLKYLWHQESQFYPNHRLGLHIWFPVFRNVKSNNDGGIIFALNGFKKNDNELINYCWPKLNLSKVC